MLVYKAQSLITCTGLFFPLKERYKGKPVVLTASSDEAKWQGEFTGRNSVVFKSWPDGCFQLCIYEWVYVCGWGIFVRRDSKHQSLHISEERSTQVANGCEGSDTCRHPRAIHWHGTSRSLSSSRPQAELVIRRLFSFFFFFFWWLFFKGRKEALDTSPFLQDDR